MCKYSLSPDSCKSFRNCLAFYFGVTGLVVVPFDFYVFSGGCSDTLKCRSTWVSHERPRAPATPWERSPQTKTFLFLPPQNLSQRTVNSKGINRFHFHWPIPWFYLQLCDRRELWGSIHCASTVPIDKYFIILNKHVFQVKFLWNRLKRGHRHSVKTQQPMRTFLGSSMMAFKRYGEVLWWYLTPSWDSPL